MTERLILACFVLVLTASLAVAQDPPSGGGDFCAIAPQALLVALDGSWSMEQGPGFAIGGVPIPLPAHPPVAMRLEYVADGGYAILSGQGQQMAMVPMVTETATEVLGDWSEHFVSSTEGMEACDWYALPTLMGSNVYALRGAIPPDMATVLGEYSSSTDSFAVGIFACVGGRTPVFIAGGTSEGVGYGQADEVLDYSRFCGDKGMRSTQGDMSMTISLKFDSPSSARGMLTFSGEYDGYPFAAWAPITLFR